MIGERIVREQSAIGELRNQSVRFRGAEEEIDFRERFNQFVLVTLDQASHRNHCLTGPAVLQPTCFDDRIDRLTFRGVDEATRVDDDDVGLLEIGGLFGAVRE